MTKRWALVVAVTLLITSIDQITKQLIINHLALGESLRPIPAIDAFFKLTRSYNTGAAFGILPQVGDYFLILVVIIVTALIYFYPRIPENAIITRLATGMVLGGAIGNALDRIRHEHVVDFIHYRIPGVISNVSNLADHAIVIGVILILYDNWRMERLEKQKSAHEETTPDTNLPYNESAD